MAETQRNPWYYGNELMLFVGTKALAYATSHTFSMSAETEQISTKDHGQSPATLSNSTTWEITTENLYTSDFYILQQAMINHQELNVVFGTPTNYDTVPDGSTDTWGKKGIHGSEQQWGVPAGGLAKGKAIVTSLTVNANAGENATYSATLTGSGGFETLTPETQAAEEEDDNNN